MTERPQPVFPSSSPPSSQPAFLYGAAVIGAGETVASIGEALTAAVLAPASGGWRLAVAGTLPPILVWIALRPSVPAALGAAGAGWWIGIAAGCLMISGLLLLADVAWRCGIARLAQSAALLGAGLAALHPVPAHPVSLAALIVTGFGLWAAALLPDLAVLRDRLGAGPHHRARLYRALSLGWRGSALQWLAWERACRGLALLGILAAVAVLIDLALAAALRTDRHDTLLPVALLVEAVLSGAGLIAALAVVLRRSLGLGGLVTGRHLDILGRLILAFGLAALYCHVTEIVTAILYGDASERARLTRRLLGDEAPAFWTFMLAGLLPTQFFWIPAIRRSPAALGLTGALVACGLGADHVLAARIAAAGTGLPDLLPELMAAGAAALGSVGLFVLGLLLLFRLVPPVSIAETRRLALLHNPQAGPSPPIGHPAMQGAVQGAVQEPGQGAMPRTGRDPSPGLVAVFASEAGLAEAARELSASDAPPRLDAFGPVPMPEAGAALHRDERSLNRFALSGAFLAAAVYIVVRAAGFAGELPSGIADGLMGVAVSAWTLSPSLSSLPVLPPVWPLSWAMAAVPALSAAAAGGSVGIAVALLRALRGARTGRPLPSDLAGHFLLTVEPASEPFNPAALARRLTSLPASAGRPLAVYGPAAGRPLR
ncbi:DUF3341 domain-containing protein [Methylorubrum thiocyanatum]|uniref:DUF3341 domain-containing protein n=1 Tax=Methylorubrum thiocyanatum TaxID=47958 RepID=UPI00383BB493